MKLATKLNANLVQGAGLALTVAAIFQPRHSPLEDILSTLGLVLVYSGLAIHSYIWGHAAGKREKLRVEINRVWSEQQPFQTKTFREGASK